MVCLVKRRTQRKGWTKTKKLNQCPTLRKGLVASVIPGSRLDPNPKRFFIRNKGGENGKLEYRKKESFLSMDKKVLSRYSRLGANFPGLPPVILWGKRAANEEFVVSERYEKLLKY